MYLLVLFSLCSLYSYIIQLVFISFLAKCSPAAFQRSFQINICIFGVKKRAITFDFDDWFVRHTFALIFFKLLYLYNECARKVEYVKRKQVLTYIPTYIQRSFFYISINKPKQRVEIISVAEETGGSC